MSLSAVLVNSAVLSRFTLKSKLVPSIVQPATSVVLSIVTTDWMLRLNCCAAS